MSLQAPTLQQLADALEIPDCDCPDRFRKICACEHECDCPRFPGEPCEHILASDHDTSLGRWATILRMVNPKIFGDPPRPTTRVAVLKRRRRVAIYEERRSVRATKNEANDAANATLGVSLFNPEDAWQGNPASDSEEELQSSTRGKRLRNGRSDPVECGTWDEDDEDIADDITWIPPQTLRLSGTTPLCPPPPKEKTNG